MTLFSLSPGHLQSFGSPSYKLAPNTDGGGTGTAGESEMSDADEPETNEDDGEEEAAEGSDEGKSKQSKYVPYKRFQKRHQLAKEYESLGLSPEDMRNVLRNYQELLNEINKAQLQKDEGTATPKKARISAEKRQQLIEDLEELIPGISKIGVIASKLQALDGDVQDTKVAGYARTLQRAADRIPELLADAHFDIGDKRFVKEVERQVASIVGTDKSLMQRLQRGDLSVVDEVFESVNKNFLSKYLSHMRRKPKIDLPSLLKEAEGKSSGRRREGGDADESPREKKMRLKRQEDREFYELYKELEEANKS
jgi:hypothetical protein